MVVVTQESLWQMLNDVRFTTPLLREWMPFIEERLRDKTILEDAYVFGCECGVLSASTADLDGIVSSGLADRELIIPNGIRHSDEHKEPQCSAA